MTRLTATTLPRWPSAFSALAMVLCACVGERIVSEEQPAATGIVVHVRPEALLRDAAAAYGWTGGGVPGASVIVSRSDHGTLITIDSLVTDSSGSVHIDSLSPGSYGLRAERGLSAAETSALSSALPGVYALEGVWSLTIIPNVGSAEVTVSARGIDRGSLVISEVYPPPRLISASNYYYFDNYVQLYNNADTAVSLAGLIFFQGFHSNTDVASAPCAAYGDLMRDSAGVWSRLVYRFPADAPALQPGGIAVLATDAIDHTQFSTASGFFDLSAADFEFPGTSDVDNPTSRNMTNVGPGEVPFGHGWIAIDLRNAIGVALPLDPDTLPVRADPVVSDYKYVRIPIAAVLDVIQWRSIYTPSSGPWCEPPLPPALDVGDAQIITPEDTLSMHRRVRYRAAANRAVLQRSRSSAADWFAGRATPFAIP